MAAGIKVMVTGGLGAIGSFATRDLVERGERPLVCDNRRDFLLLKDISDQLHFEEIDICDLPRLVDIVKKYKVERIIHTAALMPPACRQNPLRAIAVNIQGFANVMEAAKTIDAKKVVFASTGGVYAARTGVYGRPSYKPITEDYPKEPYSLYDATRFFCERCGLQYSENYGPDFVALRFAHTYGPGKLTHGRGGSGQIASYIIDSAIRGAKVGLLRGGEQRQEFVYNRDIGRALVLACFSGSTVHRQFHIGSGEMRSFFEVGDIVKGLIPGAQIEIGPGGDPLGHGSDGDRYFCYDMTRAREELGYIPKYMLEEGIKDYIGLVRKLDNIM